jgi:hypothetical protein
VGHRNKRWDLIAQKYLKVKELELVRTNKCRRSTSAYRNPIQLVPYMERIKDFLDKHGEKSVELMDDPAYAKIVSKFYRMTIDMRLLNIITEADLHPLPRVADCLDRFYNNNNFSSHDVQDAFWAVPLAECDRHKTAFETLNHLLEWLVIPQGCKNGATMFARVVTHYFADMHEDIDKYQDDIFIHSKDSASHMARHEEVMDRARTARLCFSKEKPLQLPPPTYTWPPDYSCRSDPRPRKSPSNRGLGLPLDSEGSSTFHRLDSLQPGLHPSCLPTYQTSQRPHLHQG